MSINGEGDPFDELKIRRYFVHFLLVVMRLCDLHHLHFIVSECLQKAFLLLSNSVVTFMFAFPQIGVSILFVVALVAVLKLFNKECKRV